MFEAIVGPAQVAVHDGQRRIESSRSFPVRDGFRRLQVEQQITQQIFGPRVVGLNGQSRLQHVDRLQSIGEAVVDRQLSGLGKALLRSVQLFQLLLQVAQVVEHERIDLLWLLGRCHELLQYVHCVGMEPCMHVVGGQFQVRFDFAPHHACELLPRLLGQILLSHRQLRENLFAPRPEIEWVDRNGAGRVARGIRAAAEPTHHRGQQIDGLRVARVGRQRFGQLFGRLGQSSTTTRDGGQLITGGRVMRLIPTGARKLIAGFVRAVQSEQGDAELIMGLAAARARVIDGQPFDGLAQMLFGLSVLASTDVIDSQQRVGSRVARVAS